MVQQNKTRMQSVETHRFMLSVSRENFPALHNQIKTQGPQLLARKHRTGLLEFMLRTVVNQQLSAAAAHSIWQRLQAECKRKNISLKEIDTEFTMAQLQSCGLSNTKAKAIINLSREFRLNKLSGRSIQGKSTDELAQWVGQFYGCGSWSSQMIAIFYCGHPDVWPSGDAALMRSSRRLAPTIPPSQLAEYFIPYRTTLARHLWQAL